MLNIRQRRRKLSLKNNLHTLSQAIEFFEGDYAEKCNQWDLYLELVLL